MTKRLFELNNKVNSLRDFAYNLRQGMPLAIFGVTDSFKDFLVAGMENRALYVVKDMISAYRTAEAIKELSDKIVTVIPPKDEILFINRAFSKDSLYERIIGTANISKADVVIATPEALMQTFSCSIESLTFIKDTDADQKEYVKKLVAFGYTRVESVESKGTFAVRGDILDIFPINAVNPVRIDFFGDTVESIREYDAESRQSIGFLDSVEVLQAVEILFDAQDKTKLLEIIKKETLEADKDKKLNLKALADNLSMIIQNDDYASLTPVASASKYSCYFDYLLPKDFVVVFDEGKRVYDNSSLVYTEFNERFNSLFKAGEVFSISQRGLLTLEEFKNKLLSYREVTFQTLSGANGFFNPLQILNPVVSGVANYRLDFKELFLDVKNWIKSNYTVYIFAGSVERAEKIRFDLYTNGVNAVISDAENSGVIISPKKVNQGFVFHEEKVVVIGTGNLFAKPVSQRKIKTKKANFFTAPETGDYCVHEIHGIGRVLGSKKISSTEGTKDYIAVEYSGGDILYIPVEQMDILTRYLGGDKKPKLSKIGGKDFDKLKRSVKESIKKMSFDLKKLYEERSSLQGFKYERDEGLEGLFQGSFEFEDTPDQEIAVREITEDMTSSKVMDRLVCGDVGFGKTEVAFRAVFLAILNGKQVAMLAPTTILTEQHYNTALNRFKDFGIRIACLNRFKTPKQQQQILELVKNGEIDFVIGTHRLLSKDVAFKDLGLLVLDEEQRFGVEHKEKIKLLRKNVDTLTLSATPIPRTLHMALSGIREISTLNTPPKKRLPVQTYVAEETDTLIKDAINREINRGGQVFLLYNRVETIFSFAERIKAILPSVKITVVHGQMEERVMESNILSFYRGETDVLISTTIIENGIDLPKANTLIVIDADMLGLSTLYQLKGRVGRSTRLAYAYFTFKREKILSETAYNRLNAIIEFTEMGSGIKIAMRDLEIRGAGNVLGAEQHGHMDKVGYELYSKLLKEELSGEEDLIAELDIRVTAYIPDEYIQSNSAKMASYKQIAEISSLKDQTDVIEALSEEYGELPLEVENLINISTVKFLAKRFNVSQITVRKSEVSLAFESVKAFSDKRLMRAIDTFDKKAYISMADSPKIAFVNKGIDNSTMLEMVKEFLKIAVND